MLLLPMTSTVRRRGIQVPARICPWRPWLPNQDHLVDLSSVRLRDDYHSHMPAPDHRAHATLIISARHIHLVPIKDPPYH